MTCATRISIGNGSRKFEFMTTATKTKKKVNRQHVMRGASLVRLGERWVRIGKTFVGYDSDIGLTMRLMGEEAIAEGKATRGLR